MPGFNPTALKKVLSTNSTSSAYQLAADVLLRPTESASIKRVPVGRSLAAIVVFTSTDGNNEQGLCTIYAEYEIAASDDSMQGEFVRFPMGVATITAGANVGASGGIAIASTDYVVDTISWTANAFLTAAESAFNEGSSTAYSPGDDTQACLFLPCLARCSSLIFDFKIDGSGTDPSSLNALVSFAPI